MNNKPMKQQEHWAWRQHMVQELSGALDMERCGVKALYLIGSVKSGNVGPCSDIDLLAHCEDDPEKLERLQCWCEGWGLALSVVNATKTGFATSGSLIDLHIITDKDIEQGSSFAHMLESVSNTAKLLRKRSADA